MKIDAHVHVFTTDMPLIDNPRHAPKYSFTHEQLIATLDDNGIDRAVIAAASPWGDYNDYTLAALRAHPRRLRGTVILKPTVERYALEAMARDGVCGVRLPFIGLPKLPDIATFEYRAFFRRLADLGWHVHPHVDGDDLRKILPTLEASGVKIVVDHLGRPDPKTGIASDGFKALLRSIDKGRTWVKVSAGYRLGPQAVTYARELLRAAGPDRLVWASDCPFVGHENQFAYKSTMDWLAECVPDPAARAKVFGETAFKLYFDAAA
ncbi:MAG: hydrolase [Alphaproteobacteria bacterium]|nr:hydrolase [Alphaproteobacteria bacterium]